MMAWLEKILGNGKQTNRELVIAKMKKIRQTSSPVGWEKMAGLAVGGLTEVGFSKQTNLLLVISSSGRSVVDCNTGDKIARDYEEYGDWYDSINMTCLGIGPLSDEEVTISGLCGGGLPLVNYRGETIERIAPEWPVEELIFCPPGKSAFWEEHQQDCCRFYSSYLIACGFSWDGQFMICATSSDIDIWKRTNAIA